MNNCSHCGAPIKENYKMCSGCGTILITLSTETSAHINLLRKKIEAEPKDVKLRLELGSLYQRHDLLYEALDEYKTVLGLDANNYDAHCKSAIIYLKLKDLSRAENGFRTALHIQPQSEEAIIGLFRVYYLENKVVEAIALGERIVKLKPDNVEFHMLLKNLYKQKGDKEKVLLELQKLESLVPDNEQVIEEIVQYFTDQNDIAGLIKYYQKMEEMKIEDIKLGFAIGKYYYDCGEYDKAIEHFIGLFNKQNISDEMVEGINIYLILSHFARGDISNATSLTRELPVEKSSTITEELAKKLASIFYEIGKHFLGDNKSKEAISFFTRAINYDPGVKDYQQILEKTRAETTLANKKLLSKTLSIAAGAVVVVIVLMLVWHLSHNKIVLFVEPSDGVAIFIDNKQMELQSKKPGMFETPEMFISAHTVVIEREGYNRWQKKVNIGFGGDVIIKAALIPIYGYFRVNSQPESANVYLDGELVGKTPYVSAGISAVSHKLGIEFPGYQFYTQQINIMPDDTIDLGVVVLKNLAGIWIGSIGENGVTYNASFEMTIKQDGSQIKVKYQHTPSRELSYKGEFNGIVLKDDFLADGNVNCKWRNVFYWENAKRRVIIKGKLSEDWERIEGTHFAEGLGEHKWWAVRKK